MKMITINCRFFRTFLCQTVTQHKKAIEYQNYVVKLKKKHKI